MDAPDVLVAMSGGVDSTVTALLLSSEGRSVAGVTLRMHDPDRPCTAQGSVCALSRDEEIAAAAAHRLGIEHCCVDVRDVFAREVLDRFCRAYRTGATPNPCTFCNPRVKFSEMLRFADQCGVPFISSGHYARIGRDEATGRSTLATAADPAKDQSYVLYGLSQEALSRTLLPLGGRTKQEVRRIAAAAGLGNADKPDSEDICFIPDGDYAGYLIEHAGFEPVPGPIVDARGRVLGTHRGLFRYTVGQRKGIGVAGPEPYYVLALDTARNRLVIGTRDQLGCSSCLVDDANWVSIPCPDTPIGALVKTRYHQRAVPARIVPLSEHGFSVEFATPLPAVAIGQAAVAYGEDRGQAGALVLAGGTIASTVPA